MLQRKQLTELEYMGTALIGMMTALRLGLSRHGAWLLLLGVALFACGGFAGSAQAQQDLPPLVFVQRQIPDQGTIYWSVPNALPGVGAHSRVRPAAPGRLLVRESDGSIRTLVDGSQPSTTSPFNLIDVNSPAVSWDGQTIVFSGLPQGAYPLDPSRDLGAWRLYEIAADGSNLRQVTFTDITADYTPLGQGSQPWAYDDFDPAFLPDGRIVFASTRWPGFGHYSGVRSSNLWVVDADGGRLHRITSERNGADRPLIDPVSGKIVFSRWWRNHRFATNDTTTVGANCNNGQYPYPCYTQHEGLTIDRNNHVGGADALFRNAWQSSFINLDGSGLAMFSGRFRNESDNHVYGGAFTPDGDFLANYYPQFNMTEASGFGGIRRFARGSGLYQPVNGITRLTLEYVHCPQPNDCSYGVFVPPAEGYTSDPVPLADGRLVYSAAPDHLQDYGLWVLSADGSLATPLFDQVGTSELRAQLLAPRPLPPVLPDPFRDNWENTAKPEHIPPSQDGPYDRDGTFVFDALNVYFNAPVDSGIVSAPGVGSAGSIRFYVDHQRRTTGSFPVQDWPILLNELPVSTAGRVTDPAAPAYLPLFEQLRTLASAGYNVPVTGGPYTNGAAHVAGMNYGRDGTVSRCVGCHAGHTQIPIPADPAWTNLAPGAEVQVSSARDAQFIEGVIDRRVQTGEIFRYWNSDPAQPQDGQWVQLIFPVPVVVREVRLYNPRFGDNANSSIQVHQARVRLFSDESATQPLAQGMASELSVDGTPVLFNDRRARVVRIDLDDVSGTFFGLNIASLAEIEVIARGDGLIGDDEILQDSFE